MISGWKFYLSFVILNTAIYVALRMAEVAIFWFIPAALGGFLFLLFVFANLSKSQSLARQAAKYGWEHVESKRIDGGPIDHVFGRGMHSALISWNDKCVYLDYDLGMTQKFRDFAELEEHMKKIEP